MSDEQNKPAEDQAKKEDLMRRVKEFNGKLIPLLGEYKLALGATPFITPDGRIAAKPQLFEEPTKEEVEKTDSEITPA